MGTEVDLDPLKRHFQNINASLITNTVNILLTLTVGVAAFGVNILVTAKGALGGAAAGWLIAAFVLLLGAALAGIGIQFTRIEDYRRTIRTVVMRQQHPSGVITDRKTLEEAKALKRRADRLNKATNILLYVQPSLFILGFVSLAISVLITNGGKLK